MKVGDIVKFTGKDGKKVVGILYENGNKTPGSFRVQTIGIEKFKNLIESDLKPATSDELVMYVASAVKAVEGFSPELVIEQETAEAGGVLPEPLPEPSVEG